jgi:hypothetical protein
VREEVKDVAGVFCFIITLQYWASSTCGEANTTALHCKVVDLMQKAQDSITQACVQATAPHQRFRILIVFFCINFAKYTQNGAVFLAHSYNYDI